MTEKTTTSKQIPIDESNPLKSTSTKPVPLAFTLDPSSGPEQTPVTITGKDFGDTAGTVRLHEVPAPVLTWSDSTITTTVPYGTAPKEDAAKDDATAKDDAPNKAAIAKGDLVVRTADGRSAAAAFTVTAGTWTPETRKAKDA